MKKIIILLVAALAFSSCAVRPEEWEKDFTGTWSLVGMADLEWSRIEDMMNFNLAKTIDKNLYEASEMTFVFGNGRVKIEGEDNYTMTGDYTIDEDGVVSVDWDNSDQGDVYWMYAQGNYLYMVEMSLDDYGEISAMQDGFKFVKISK